MRVAQTIARNPAELAGKLATLQANDPGLLLVFASVTYFADGQLSATLREAFPKALLLGCSTAGEITAAGVDDGTCSVTALHFDSVQLVAGSTPLAGMEDSFDAGQRLGHQLRAPGLKAILLCGPGVHINGSALVDGLVSVVGDKVTITGGLAGDGGAFQRTYTLGRDGITDSAVVAVGLCGDALQFAHGSFGGWEPFGPARKVTRCAGNILYELDGEPALEVYKRYLGTYAKDLPASGLLFPFAMLGEDQGEVGLIRTILGVDESAGSLTLAGAIDQDGYLKLMHASTDKLVGGAEAAAEAAADMLADPGEGLALLVSCVGRKLVMGSRVDEEVEAVGDIFGRKVVLTGFYSYGEISPFTPGASCKLHNQTMTITYLGES